MYRQIPTPSALIQPLTPRLSCRILYSFSWGDEKKRVFVPDRAMID